MKIQHLKLYSKNLPQQLKFYRDTLGFPILKSSPKSFTLKAGNSELQFTQTEQDYYYHFAFNIPGNQISEGRDWLQERTRVYPFQGEEIVDFPHLSAKAVYFLDADQNIGEFIARHHHEAPSSQAFNVDSILKISEIGLPTGDVKAIHDHLSQEYGLENFSGDLNRFAAIGSGEGCFIVINHQMKQWIPTMQDAFPHPFQLRMGLKDRVVDLAYQNGEIEKISEAQLLKES